MAEQEKKQTAEHKSLRMNKGAMASKMLQCNSLISAGLQADRELIWRRRRYGNAQRTSRRKRTPSDFLLRVPELNLSDNCREENETIP